MLWAFIGRYEFKDLTEVHRIEEYLLLPVTIFIGYGCMEAIVYGYEYFTGVDPAWLLLSFRLSFRFDFFGYSNGNGDGSSGAIDGHFRGSENRPVEDNQIYASNSFRHRPYV